MSVRRAQQEIDSAEFAEWMAFNSIEPFGEERADVRSAMICCLLANINRGKGKKAYKISDFMLDFGRKKTDQQDWREMKAIFGHAIKAAEACRKKNVESLRKN